MSIGSINSTSGNAYIPASSVGANQKPTEGKSTGTGWNIEDVVDIATDETSQYSVTFRPNVKVSLAHIDMTRSRHAGKAVVLDERELTDAEKYRLWNGSADTMGVRGSEDLPPEMQSRKRVEDFADQKPAEFEAFIRTALENGADEGTDFKEAFFKATASGDQVASYESAKAQDDQWAIANDKAGRYLAQHGVDLKSPIALTKLDDGSFANVTDHPQKHYIEHLVNTNPQLFNATWDQYHSTPGSIFPISNIRPNPS